MAVVHVRPSGTKDASGAPDYASTPDDWTLANCYSDLAKVGWNATSGSPADYIQDGDEVIFYSDVDNPVTHALVNFPPVRNIEPGGTVTFKSKDGDMDACILEGSSPTAFDVLLDLRNTETAFTFEDLTWTSSAIKTTVNQQNILIKNETGDVTFTRCRFTGYRTNYATSNNVALSNLFGISLTGTLASRTVKWTDCKFDDIVASYYTGGALIRPEQDAGKAHAIVFDGDNTFDDISYTTNNAAGALAGIINIGSNDTLTINGTLTASDITSTVIVVDKSNHAFIKCDGAMDGNGIITGNRVVVTGGSAVSGLVHVTGAFAINEIHSVDCEVIWLSDSNGTSGATFLAQTSDAIGTVNKIKATRPRSKFGAACYWSGGGTPTIGSIECIDAKVLHGAVYGGGDGDAVINSLLITGTRQDATLLSQSGDVLGDFPGVDIYVFVNESSAGRSKATTINNGTILDSDTSAGWSVDLRDTDTTYDHTAIVRNFVFNSGCTHELHTQENAAITLDVTLINCAIPTAEIDDNIGGGGGMFTNTDPITSDPQPNADGSLPEGSALIGAGIRWWNGSPNPVGADGEPFSDIDTDIGGIQSTWGLFHPVNL